MSGSFEDQLSVARWVRQECRRMVQWLVHLNVGPPGLSSVSDVFMTFMHLKIPLRTCPNLLISVETGNLFLLASVPPVWSMNSGTTLPQGWHEYRKMVKIKVFVYQSYVYKACSHPRYIPIRARKSQFPMINENIFILLKFYFILVHPQDGKKWAFFSVLLALSCIYCCSVFVVVVSICSCSRPQFLQLLEDIAGGEGGL